MMNRRESLFSAEVLRLSLDMPWKARNELERLLLLPLARAQFALAGVDWGVDWRLYGLPIMQIHRRSFVRIGARLELRSTVRSNPLGPSHAALLSTREAGASLVVGDDFGMTGGSIVAAQSIRIGNRVIIGADSIVSDTDFHPLAFMDRRSDPLAGASAPVIIEDDVFIGMRTLVLKGVTIGRGSVIGAGSVVTRSLPPEVVAAGNPAKIIREL